MHRPTRKVALCCLVAAGAACHPTSSVVGRVIDAQRQPRAGVSVFAVHDRRPVAEARTDAAGRFRLDVEPWLGTVAIFGLAPGDGDLGVWRPTIAVNAGAVSDAFDLELHAVSSHADVRWLRDVGFDEQFMADDASLMPLSGGPPGQPLVALRQRPASVEVLVIGDDGRAEVLREVAGVLVDFSQTVVDAAGLRIVPGGGPPLFFFTERLVDGRWVLAVQRGGLTQVGAQGVTTSPIEHLTWLELPSGQTLLEVPVPAGAEAVVLPARGVLLREAGRQRWFEVGAAGPRALADAAEGELFAEGDAVFRLTPAPGRLRLDRLDGSAFQHGPAVELSESFLLRQRFAEDGTIGALGVEPSGRVVLVRFDRVTLAARVEGLPGASEALGAEVSKLFPRIGRGCAGVPGAAVVTLQEGGLRVIRATARGLTAEDVATPLGRHSAIQAACVAPAGWWLTVSEGS
ncbi:MAG: carboxypeptidase regulatory-like domain-containing protein, partial [Myxococcaceae bacterium]|nr:carboxypeptidase regulatory-like domain-containing protein [Myxococcaceae bacterium]